ncbi:hypothetical protein OF846_001951 [Rhodotorula toruloides]|nr:hypothetical protein OF846_001951 [Rhodotorula toruloides]
MVARTKGGPGERASTARRPAPGDEESVQRRVHSASRTARMPPLTSPSGPASVEESSRPRRATSRSRQVARSSSSSSHPLSSADDELLLLLCGLNTFRPPLRPPRPPASPPFDFPTSSSPTPAARFASSSASSFPGTSRWPASHCRPLLSCAETHDCRRASSTLQQRAVRIRGQASRGIEREDFPPVRLDRRLFRHVDDEPAARRARPWRERRAGKEWRARWIGDGCLAGMAGRASRNRAWSAESEGLEARRRASRRTWWVRRRSSGRRFASTSSAAREVVRYPPVTKRAAASCTCSSTLLPIVPGLYHAAAHHVNRGSTTASTSRLTYFAFSPPRLFASNPTPTIALDAFAAHDAMCCLKHDLRVVGRPVSRGQEASDEGLGGLEQAVVRTFKSSTQPNAVENWAESVHVRLVMNDSTQRRSERDNRVFGRSTRSSAEMVPREELERVCEVRPFAFDRAGVIGVVWVCLVGAACGRFCGGSCSATCGSTTGKRTGWRSASLSVGDVATLFTTFHKDASLTSSTSALSALLFSRLIKAFALFVATFAARVAVSASSPSPTLAFVRYARVVARLASSAAPATSALHQQCAKRECDGLASGTADDTVSRSSRSSVSASASMSVGVRKSSGAVDEVASLAYVRRMAAGSALRKSRRGYADSRAPDQGLDSTSMTPMSPLPPRANGRVPHPQRSTPTTSLHMTGSCEKAEGGKRGETSAADRGANLLDSLPFGASSPSPFFASLLFSSVFLPSFSLTPPAAPSVSVDMSSSPSDSPLASLPPSSSSTSIDQSATGSGRRSSTVGVGERGSGIRDALDGVSRKREGPSAEDSSTIIRDELFGLPALAAVPRNPEIIVAYPVERGGVRGGAGIVGTGEGKGAAELWTGVDVRVPGPRVQHQQRCLDRHLHQDLGRVGGEGAAEEVGSRGSSRDELGGYGVRGGRGGSASRGGLRYRR